jgi:general secretion pathway protein M
MNRADLILWYQGLSARDQRMIRYGSIAAAIILIAAIVFPLQFGTRSARQRVEHKQADLAYMRRVAPTIAAAGPMPAASATPESLVVLIDRTARESGLSQALTGSQPGSNGSMRVRMEKADFNALVAWLSRLSTQQGVRVEAATVEAAGEPGLVSANFDLRIR